MFSSHFCAGVASQSATLPQSPPKSSCSLAVKQWFELAFPAILKAVCSEISSTWPHHSVDWGILIKSRTEETAACYFIISPGFVGINYFNFKRAWQLLCRVSSSCMLDRGLRWQNIYNSLNCALVRNDKSKGAIASIRLKEFSWSLGFFLFKMLNWMFYL